MFARQAARTPALELGWVADLARGRARAAAKGAPTGTDAGGLIEARTADVVVEATGNPLVAVRHALTAIEHGQHVVNVTVEADVVAGPALARRAAAANL